MSVKPGRILRLEAADGSSHEVECRDDVAVVGGEEISVKGLGGGQYRAGGATLWAVGAAHERWVFAGGRTYVFVAERHGGRVHAGSVDQAGHSAPMPATVTRIQVAPGDRVRAGDVLATLEAMKMELPIRAAADGVVTSVRCHVGELVQPGQPLLEIEAAT